MEQDFQSALLKLDLKDGDVIFVDGAAINLNALYGAEWLESMPAVTIIAIYPAKDQTVTDAVFRMSKADLEEIVKS